jgi:hypothetical protein
MLRRLFLVMLLLCAGCARTASPSAPNKVFDASTTSALAHSSVPVYLPAWIPEFTGTRKTLYATATLYPLGYLVTVDPIKGCNGGGTCSFVVLSATTDPPASGGLAVALHDGSAAHFRTIICGRTCALATLEWQKGRYTYIIQMKSGDESTVVRMADSYVALR